MDIIQILADELVVRPQQVEAVITLLNEGSTIPFIARYRKEATGALDDEVLRKLFDRREYLLTLQARMDAVIKSIEEQEKLTPELQEAILNAKTLTEVEDLYRPYKPKKKTRASIAKEKGLEPLANYIKAQVLKTPLLEEAAKYINEEKKVLTPKDALEGAKDILAEAIADVALYRTQARIIIKNFGKIVTKEIAKEEKGVFDMYADYQELISKIPPHRILAMNRGEAQKCLRVSLVLPDEEIIQYISRREMIDNSPFADVIQEVILDSYKRLIYPSVETEVRNELTEKAEEVSMDVFQENLRQLLLVAPLKGKTILGYDPAFRTGCKLAVLDPTGKVLAKTVIYPTEPRNDILGSEKTILKLIDQFKIDYIAIGNGTASRESEAFVKAMIEKFKLPTRYVIVNEAGASVYSASDVAREEFPDYHVEERSAVSIGRRLQDPLAELVKIDPKAIGVGQYQHDMNQKRLGEVLSGVVESCVNTVGVDLNNASPSLLTYVSGITPTLAKNIVSYRETHGRFASRKELLKVSKLGPKAYEQCAGFLRIRDQYPLDNTAVHPESYDVTKALLKELGLKIEAIGTDDFNERLNHISSLEELAKKLNVGVLTLKDIIEELKKPGRDPRDEAVSAHLSHEVVDIKDLKVGMVINGTVRNIMDFGVFVDIGVHQDGLVHISEIANRFIKHPLDVLKLNDIVKVKVISVDVAKKRIGLSIKQV